MMNEIECITINDSTDVEKEGEEILFSSFFAKHFYKPPPDNSGPKIFGDSWEDQNVAKSFSEVMEWRRSRQSFTFNDALGQCKHILERYLKYYQKYPDLESLKEFKADEMVCIIKHLLDKVTSLMGQNLMLFNKLLELFPHIDSKVLLAKSREYSKKHGPSLNQLEINEVINEMLTEDLR